MDKKYKGMTVNERLFISGLMPQFLDAIKNKNSSMAIKILEKVELTKANIAPILKKYGFPDSSSIK